VGMMGMIAAPREPHTPIVSALLHEARVFARVLSER